MVRPVWVLVACALATALGYFTDNCPQQCKCMWSSGYKKADCSSADLNTVPRTLSTEIQKLDLSGNSLHEIIGMPFQERGLINLKKLTLSECKLITFERDGLSGLTNLIELNLSKNKLKTLHANTFRETVIIRRILLNDNLLEVLEDGLFNDLKFLEEVYLNDNRIYHISPKIFTYAPKLNILRIDRNNLEHLNIDALSASTSLSYVDVHGNPWRCDCNLRPFRNWVISKNLYTAPVSCAGPPRVQGKLWKELDPSEFVCKPSIVYPSSSVTLRTSDNNVTLSCHVEGNPLPKVTWVLKKQINNDTEKRLGKIKYHITETVQKNSKWIHLTVVDVVTDDNGEYLCVSENSGGVEERSFTLAYTPGTVTVHPSHPPATDKNIIAIIIGYLYAILLMIMLVLYAMEWIRQRHSANAYRTNNNRAIDASSETGAVAVYRPSPPSPSSPPPPYDAVPPIPSGSTNISVIMHEEECPYRSSQHALN